MRRKASALTPLEVAILAAAQQMDGTPFYGYALAPLLTVDKHLTRNGTIYRALVALERRGYLQSKWSTANQPGRGIPRRLYQLVATPPAAPPASETE